MIRVLALLLTALTGFAALAYEIAWQRYLATLLGAHSEATAAVLAIFLGGLSAGYWLFGALTRHLVARGRARGGAPPLLVVYGLVEAAIGVYALLFPWLFRGAQALSLWLPTGGGLLAFAADTALAAALIAPPAILMGATIPILTQALSRDLEDATRLHSLVYALNSAGAFAGALAGGFVLVPWLGLDGVARAMGAINLGAGAAFVALGTVSRDGSPDLPPPPAASSGSAGPGPAYAAAALAVGFGTMACQTILIRVGGLTLGSSEFTFSMVVAAFVSAIAVGSLGVAALGRVGRAVLPLCLWALTLAFALLYLGLEDAPYWGHVVRSVFSSHEGAFYAFYGAALLATLLVIGPPAALSGAALPLLFDAVREEMGELGARAGRLYSQNTIGSLLGALAGGYALLFWLDLHQVYRVALAAFALAAAAVSARVYAPTRRWAGAALAAPALASVALLPAWEAPRLSAGLFRTRTPQAWTHQGPDAIPRRSFLFHEDGPNSTVAVMAGIEDSVSILVNGKSDGNTKGDLQTMALAAMLPALFAERAERAFVIGFGTGITAGYLAELESMRRVTVAEISGAVLRAAPYFDATSFGASHHPKIDALRSDAYRALLRSDERYDVIVSEPSNPWVAGVEMLFSREFLQAARARLAPGGVYVQWYHVYETNDHSVELVLQTYAETFERVAIWQSNAADLLILGFAEGARSLDLERIAARAALPDVQRLLASLDVETLPELLVHEQLPEGVVHATPPAALPPHTLYHPRLSHHAGRGFFVGDRASLPFTGYGEPARIGRRNALLSRYLERFGDSPPEETWDLLSERACALNLPICSTLLAASAVRGSGDAARARLEGWRGRARPGSGIAQVRQLVQLYAGAPPGEGVPLSRARRLTRLFEERYHHAFPFPPRVLVSIWQRCRGGEGAGAECRAGLARARALAAGRRPLR